MYDNRFFSLQLEMWFQQDATTIITTQLILVLLHEKFSKRVIIRYVDVSWPPRSKHLMPLDFLVGLRQKSNFCSTNCLTLEHLGNIILQIITLGKQNSNSFGTYLSLSGIT